MHYPSNPGGGGMWWHAFISKITQDPAWAQAFYSAAAIVVSAVIAVAVPTYTDRLAQRRAQAAAIGSIADAIMALSDLTGYFRATQGKNALVFAATLGVCQETLTDIDPATLRSPELASAVFKLRREIAFLVTVLPDHHHAYDRKAKAMESVLDFALQIFRDVSRTGKIPGEALPSGFPRFFAEWEAAHPAANEKGPG